jgi:uncharacterized membrane protein YgcG
LSPTIVQRELSKQITHTTKASSDLIIAEAHLRSLDFSSLHALITTLLSLAVITLLGVGIRLVTQLTIQQRQQRMNRQINERLRALIAAYKTLGGSFTGDLTVNPAHHRDSAKLTQAAVTASTPPLDLGAADQSAQVPGADRARRIRDAVEAALSDIILLGTQEQVRLAAKAAYELSTGKLVHTEELVVSLRAFIREALDLDPIPAEIIIPQQGPARPSASGGKGKSDRSEEGKAGSDGGGGGTGGGGMGGGMGGGFGFGSGSHSQNSSDEEEGDDPSSHNA